MTTKLKVRRIHVYFTLVLLVFGFIVAYSFQFTRNELKDSSVSVDNEWDKKVALNERIIHEKEKNAELADRLEKIREQVNKKEKDLSARQLVSQQTVRQLDTLRMRAGLVPVIGPGVTVTLADSKNARTMTDVANGIVHDKNIRDVVNELFAAGAEGVSVNDQRLVTNSTVRCVGPTIIVNDTKLAPPFVVRAIGNKDTLMTALEMPGGVIDVLKQRTVDVQVVKSDKIELPGFIGETKDASSAGNPG
ncbi:DUF881 domain-containing protein [Aneurinibacillus terranovensis]|uniref:DUF881 domain-containing protein n=1 Tax=Aneurinibacillus terranovensis TaxID=278991 RepID=UPI0004832780